MLEPARQQLGLTLSSSASSGPVGLTAALQRLPGMKPIRWRRDIRGAEDVFGRTLRRMNGKLIRPTDLEPLQGHEPLGGGTVADFWRWALGDLRMNNARGYLVEYLVAQAIGDRAPIRVEWGPYDACGADGTLVGDQGNRLSPELGHQGAVNTDVGLQERHV